MKLLFLCLLGTGLVSRAEDWTTTDGITYKDVTVLSHDAGYVTILDSDGGGKVQLRLLSPGLQKKYGYDPLKAAAFVAQTEAQDKAERVAVERAEESEDAAKQKRLVDEQQPPASSMTSQTSPAPTAAPKIDDAQRQQIQSEIDNLNSDVAMMQREVAKNSSHDNGSGYVGANNKYSAGGYPAKIQDDQQQIAALQQQLNGR